ncbi:MAG TPA: DUF1559 domain-containing protein [Gemmataceae bacterium]
MPIPYSGTVLTGPFGYQGNNTNAPLLTAVQNIPDGTSNTLLMSEIIMARTDGDSNTHGDFMNDGWNTVGGRFMTINPPNSGTDTMGYCTNDDPLVPCSKSTPYQVAARSRHTNGVNALFCDGSVHFIPNGANAAVWQALGTMSGSEPIASNY